VQLLRSKPANAEVLEVKCVTAPMNCPICNEDFFWIRKSLGNAEARYKCDTELVLDGPQAGKLTQGDMCKRVEGLERENKSLKDKLAAKDFAGALKQLVS